MATYKVLGQQKPAATTNTDLYTAGSPAVVSTIALCNQGAANTNFRIAVRPAGAGLATQHYLVYDSLIGPNQTIALTLGISLASTDVVTVYCGVNTVSFSAFGVENP